ncbi:MAG: YraN family protein [Actinomycetota bacterium]
MRGRSGEQAALDRYLAFGYRLVARNWRCALGELDLVLERDGTLVVCEVKARTSATFGGGWEAVGPAKRRTIRRVTEAFLATDRTRASASIRFDVASVRLLARGAEVHVFEDAF